MVVSIKVRESGYLINILSIETEFIDNLFTIILKNNKKNLEFNVILII